MFLSGKIIPMNIAMTADAAFLCGLVLFVVIMLFVSLADSKYASTALAASVLGLVVVVNMGTRRVADAVRSRAT